jgi:CelD/BcsL family acetyltransferase involved in cellulose biosynthesis
MRLERVTDLAVLESLRPEWEELLEASAAKSVFLTWEWLSTWFRHCAGAGTELEILALRDGARLEALLPLLRVRHQLGWLRVPTLRFLGTGPVGSDDLDLIARRGGEPEAARQLAAHLAAEKALLRFDRLPRGTSGAALLAAELAGRGWAIGRAATEVCPLIELRGLDWDAYLAGLGTEHRYAVRRKLRSAARRHAARLAVARTQEERREALAILVKLHLGRWGGRGGSTAFDRPELLAFHEEFTQHALAKGWLRLLVLWLDGKPAAALYGLRHGESFAFYQSGFDATASSASPGLVLMAMAIQLAIQEGAARFDMLHGDEPYKRHWAGAARWLERIELFPPHAPALVWKRAYELGRSARRLAGRLLGEPAAAGSGDEPPVALGPAAGMRPPLLLP